MRNGKDRHSRVNLHVNELKRTETPRQSKHLATTKTKLQHQQLVVFQGGYVTDFSFWSPVIAVRLPGNQCTSPSATTKQILSTLVRFNEADRFILEPKQIQVIQSAVNVTCENRWKRQMHEHLLSGPSNQKLAPRLWTLLPSRSKPPTPSHQEWSHMTLQTWTAINSTHDYSPAESHVMFDQVLK